MPSLQSDDLKRFELLKKGVAKGRCVYSQVALDILIEALDYNVRHKFAKRFFPGKYELGRHQQVDQDKVSIELLIQNNLKLVQKIASRYLNYLGNTHTLEDLVSEGVLGLIKAIEKFNPATGYEFSAYATYWIRVVIVRAIMNTGTMVRIPVYMVELVLKIKRLEQLSKRENKDLDIQTICGKLQITPEKYKEAKFVGYQFPNLFALHSIVAEVEDTGSRDFIGTGRCHKLQYAREKFSDPAFMVEEVDFRMFIRRIMSSLSERECNVIKLRFGFYDGGVKTLQEVGEIYGITRERVRQIEIKALNKLLLKLNNCHRTEI
jgi:RNA polymerase primary sigma factor